MESSTDASTAGVSSLESSEALEVVLSFEDNSGCVTCFKLNPKRRLAGSILIIFNSSSSPSFTISFGWLITLGDISLMCISPSIPGAILAKAPKFANLVTVPFTNWPVWKMSFTSSQGWGWSRLKLNAIFKDSRSTFKINTSNSCPTDTMSSGDLTASQDSSDIWIKPSAPPMSTKAPKLEIPDTFPFLMSPSSKVSRSFFFCPSFHAWMAARSEKIARLRLLFNSIILNSTLAPIKPSFGCSPPVT